ncbi:MAG: hypothetical protein ACTSXU_01035 [Promethearchaeota archaeon]
MTGMFSSASAFNQDLS